MELEHLRNLKLAAERMMGNWWQDDRRNWCAYCGIPMRRKACAGAAVPPSKATKDHVIPRAHRGGLVTIPACRECNSAKGTMSLPEFLGSEHFLARRRNRHRNQWPVHRLWAVAGLAALKRAETTFAPPPLAHASVAQPGTEAATADHTR